MLPIAVDLLGGDHAPVAILDGARQAMEAGIPITLVGPADLVEPLKAEGFGVIVATESVDMNEDGARSVRRKKDSTLVRSAEAVRDGAASAMISAGNTGATMASALLRMGRISGVNRPAVATPIPVIGSTPTVLLDAGANAEVSPDWLVQFAQMGTVYARERFGIARPRVGLVSIGEEAGKGDSLRKEAYGLLEVAPNIAFVGNIEGRDLMTDRVDVAVTDGFTGNVALKTLEGGVRAVVSALFEALAQPDVKPHADAILPALLPLYETLDSETYGGAVLLGVNGVCIIGHGSSSAKAMFNGIKVASDLVAHDLITGLEESLVSGCRVVRRRKLHAG